MEETPKPSTDAETPAPAAEQVRISIAPEAAIEWAAGYRKGVTDTMTIFVLTLIALSIARYYLGGE